MAKSIDIFFAPYDPETSQTVLQKAVQAVDAFPNTVKIKLGEAVLQCVPEGDSEKAKPAIEAVIVAIRPYVRIVNRQ